MSKRILSFLLAVVLLLSAIPLVSFTANAYADTYPLPTLTGDQAVDTVNIALSQLGYAEDSSGGTAYGAWWTSFTNWGVDYTNLAWCAMFACWCANQAGAGYNVAYDKNGAQVTSLLSWLKNNATADTSFSTTPVAGDFIFFENGSSHHVAIVIEYDSSTNKVTFVGGNQSNKVTKSTVTWSSSAKWGSQYVVGYGRPNYSRTTPEKSVYFGIDVSHHQGTINWDTVKPQIDFAILRCGYGSDMTSQDDRQWKANADACTRLGIPFGVYIYSYATTDAQALSEAEHVLRLVQGYDPTLPIYLDLEDSSILNSCSKADILRHTQIFCDKIESAGYEVGVYANYNWWTNYLTASEYDNWDRWIARYASATGYSKHYSTWQYTSSGSIDGISGNVDLNYRYEPISGGSGLTPGITYYTLKFNAGGGTVSPSSMVVAHGCKPTVLPTPTWAKHDFDGWYTSPDGGTRITTDSTILSDMTLYAHWTEVTYYTLSFDPNGGTVSPTSMVVAHGCKPTTLPTPVQEDNTFLGWYTELIGGTEVNTDTPIMQSMKLYARWKIVEYPVPGGYIYFDRTSRSIVDCSSNATYANIPDEIEGVPVEIIGESAFWGCKITGVFIPETVLKIEKQGFGNCQNLVEVSLSEGLLEIGENAFYSCKSLPFVYLPASVNSIGYGVFWGCRNLEMIEVDSQNAGFSSTDGVLFNKAATVIHSYPNGKQDSAYNIPYGVVEILPSAFRESVNLQEVYFPETIDTIESYAFLFCDAMSAAYFYGDAPSDVGSEVFKNEAPEFVVYYISDKNGWTTPTWNGYQTRTWRPVHICNYSCVVKDPTCTQQGYTVYTCSECGDSYKADYVPALDHAEGEWIIDRNPTCTASGSKHTECTRCGEQLHSEIIPSTGHTESAWITDKNASCTTSGSQHTECLTCGIVLQVLAIPATGHSWDNGVVTTPPTEEAEGVKTYTCTACGATKTEAIPVLDHSHSYAYQVVAPTCTEQGYTLYTCSCGDSFKENFVDALGHNATDWIVDLAPTCTVAGSMHTECTRCGALLQTSAIQPSGHTESDWIIDKEATCTEGGAKHKECTVCKLRLQTESIPALGHDYREGICTRCGAEDPNWTEPEDPFVNPFIDVKENDYFYDPVLWAVQKGITNGTTPTTFSPYDPCTRGQIVTFLWRAFGSPEPEKDENPFTDVPENMYYYKAILWAVEQGITTGTSATTFSPEATCTRGQVATFLWRACGKPAPKGNENPFSDVPQTVYYYQPILWAVENGITNGTGGGKFSPEDSCTRGQIVTFLYRALAE